MIDKKDLMIGNLVLGGEILELGDEMATITGNINVPYENLEPIVVTETFIKDNLGFDNITDEGFETDTYFHDDYEVAIQLEIGKMGSTFSLCYMSNIVDEDGELATQLEFLKDFDMLYVHTLQNIFKVLLEVDLKIN